ncbi:MAG: EamA family transporter [Thiobacillus sp.]|nr:EamA family transporter [Thiobacillus sp.]
MFGLTHTNAGAASLMLNLEAVFTAVLAWVIFKENADRRIVLGMLLIVAGGAVLAWPAAGSEAPDWIGPLAIAAACLCWAIDNNLTRGSGSDALFIAGAKGLDSWRGQHRPRLVIGGIRTCLVYRRRSHGGGPGGLRLEPGFFCAGAAGVWLHLGIAEHLIHVHKYGLFTLTFVCVTLPKKFILELAIPIRF